MYFVDFPIFYEHIGKGEGYQDSDMYPDSYSNSARKDKEFGNDYAQDWNSSKDSKLPHSGIFSVCFIQCQPYFKRIGAFKGFF